MKSHIHEVNTIRCNSTENKRLYNFINSLFKLAPGKANYLQLHVSAAHNHFQVVRKKTLQTARASSA